MAIVARFLLCGGGQSSAVVSCSLVAISCTSVERSDTGQGRWKEWGESIETDTHVLHVVENLFQRSFASKPSGPTFSL